MVVPRPFTRAIYLYGAPISVPRHGDVEEWRTKVERVLNDLEAEAERDFDRLWEERGTRNDER